MRTARLRHLAGRFFTSISPRRPDPGDREWVRSSLSPAEYAVWSTLGRADRTESVAVGRRAAEWLPSGADPVWVAAALLHDVGKTEAGLGTPGRVLATIVGDVGGRERMARRSGRFGTYLRHAEIGAERLRRAGARSETAAWAAVHHRPGDWVAAGVPESIGRVLARADGEPVSGG